MKKADGWSMGQEEQKQKALEEKLRRRAYTAAFEAAQQRKEKPWQSWDEAFSERLAKQPRRLQGIRIRMRRWHDDSAPAKSKKRQNLRRARHG